jgi:ribosome-binding factor A
MESQRQLKISKLLQRELGEIFQREAAHKFAGIMITVTKVNITRDLSLARVFLSLFPAKDKDAMMVSIKSHAGEIRFFLGKRIKNQVRQIPELEFYLDDSLDYIENIENLLKDQ